MQRGTEGQPLRLSQYQIIRATVAEGGLDRVLLNVRQQKLSAETEVPLKTGQQLNLQVLSTKPRIHLRIMEAAELKHLFRLLNLLGENIRLPRLLNTIREAAGSDPFGPRTGGTLPEGAQEILSGAVRFLQTHPGKISGEDLAGLWRRLGLDMEALLAGGREAEAKAGLKAVLLQLAARFESQGIFAEGVDRVLDQLNLYQLCRHRLAQENIFFLPLPLPFLEQGYMLAEREPQSEPEEDEDEPSEPPWKMTLHLKLSSLGSLEIKLLFEEEALRMRILCDSEETAAFVGRALPRLREDLSTVALKGFSVGTGAEEPVAKLVKRLAPDGQHFLEAQV